MTAVVARFIERGIREAEQERAACVVITLDTPGGLLDSTRSVVKRILRSEVPVVVYVAPSGSRAASAGVFITLSAHVAAMAPGTNIGAAHPVQVGGLPGSPPPPSDAEDWRSTTRAAPTDEKMVNTPSPGRGPSPSCAAETPTGPPAASAKAYPPPLPKRCGSARST